MTAEHKPPARKIARHCHLMSYTLAAAQFLGSWLPFAPSTQRHTITIKVTVIADTGTLEIEKRLVTFAVLKRAGLYATGCEKPVSDNAVSRDLTWPDELRVGQQWVDLLMLLSWLMDNELHMRRANPIVFAISISALCLGLFVIAVGAFFLRRLDNHMGGDPATFYQLATHYGWITLAGAPLCVSGCLGLALPIGYREGFRAGIGLTVLSFIWLIVGLSLFSLHDASGAVYFAILAVLFGASLVFLSVASSRYIWGRCLQKSAGAKS